MLTVCATSTDRAAHLIRRGYLIRVPLTLKAFASLPVLYKPRVIAICGKFIALHLELDVIY
jgi:hypothetical protein